MHNTRKGREENRNVRPPSSFLLLLLLFFLFLLRQKKEKVEILFLRLSTLIEACGWRTSRQRVDRTTAIVINDEIYQAADRKRTEKEKRRRTSRQTCGYLIQLSLRSSDDEQFDQIFSLKHDEFLRFLFLPSTFLLETYVCVCFFCYLENNLQRPSFDLVVTTTVH